MPNFKIACIDTPSVTRSVRYVNVNGTFCAEVARIIGKWSTVKYSEEIVDASLVTESVTGIVGVDAVTIVVDGATPDVVEEPAVDDDPVVVVLVVVVLVVCVCQHEAALPLLSVYVVTPSTLGLLTASPTHRAINTMLTPSTSTRTRLL